LKAIWGEFVVKHVLPFFLIMDNNENNVTVYVGDKMVKVAKGKQVVKPSNCPQYY